jgi:hypothetical protein
MAMIVSDLQHVFYGTAFDLGRFVPGAPEDQITFKPEGGLWTSPMMATGLTAWQEFELTLYPDDSRQHRFHQKVTPTPHAKVLLIDSAADLSAVIAQYRDARFDAFIPPDIMLLLRWHQIGLDFDAVTVTEQAFAEVRYRRRAMAERTLITIWDAESTCWLHADAFTVEPCPRPDTTDSSPATA